MQDHVPPGNPLPQLASQGYEVVSTIISETLLHEFRTEAERLAGENAASAHGLRNLLRKSAVLQDWLSQGGAAAYIPAGYGPVRSILFDKVPGANWKVAWHQDLTITVDAQVDIPGYGPWSVKEGVPHVQPDLPLLESMLTLRLHLDAATTENGALRVLPGSHLHGRLTTEKIQGLRAANPEVVCMAAAGDALFMRPLILHASSPALVPSHRRVVHIEFAPIAKLAPGLRWAELPSRRD